MDINRIVLGALNAYENKMTIIMNTIVEMDFVTC